MTRLIHGSALARLFAGAAGLGLLAQAGAAGATSFTQTNLVTDSQSYLASAGYSAAATQNTGFINPWGMDHTSSGAWFIAVTGDEGSPSGQASGVFYTGAGVEQSSVVIPQTAVGPMGTGAPTGATGLVFNPSTSQFIIADLDGHLSTLNFGATSSVQVATGPTPSAGPPHSIYTGVAIGNVGGQTYVYAANNGTGAVDVYGPNFKPAALGAGAFAAPAIAAGLAPFNIQNLNGDIWVTYATARRRAAATIAPEAAARFTSSRPGPATSAWCWVRRLPPRSPTRSRPSRFCSSGWP
jgi:uncharacterized protein (TIGR03118 family)